MNLFDRAHFFWLDLKGYLITQPAMSHHLSAIGTNPNDSNISPERKLPMYILEKFMNNTYIKDKLNVIIIVLLALARSAFLVPMGLKPVLPSTK